MFNEELMVSVGMLAYNHSIYIEQAIESVLMQQTNFRIELVIAEDCSTDATRKIVKEYANKYPNIIKLVFQERNVGMQNNFNKLIESLEGRYIAFLEGDDYWVNPHKLQAQIDYLEKHPEYVATAHNTLTVDKYGKESDIINPSWRIRESHIFNKRIYGKELYAGHLSSLVMKNIFFNMDKNMKSSFYICNANPDQRLNLLIALNGGAFVFNDIMSHYRYIRDEGNSWSAQTNRENIFYYIYCCYLELEKYAEKYYDTRVNLKNQKNNIVWMAFFRYIRLPNNENKNIFFEICKKTNIITVIKVVLYGSTKKLVKLMKNFKMKMKNNVI